MTTQHTPGPWTTRVNPTSGYGYHMIEAHNGEDTIATQVHPTNARLIAAAPDMYALLVKTATRFRAAVPVSPLVAAYIEEMDALIAKVEGV